MMVQARVILPREARSFRNIYNSNISVVSLKIKKKNTWGMRVAYLGRELQFRSAMNLRLDSTDIILALSET